jgi:hypothetical protein
MNILMASALLHSEVRRPSREEKRSPQINKSFRIYEGGHTMMKTQQKINKTTFGSLALRG